MNATASDAADAALRAAREAGNDIRRRGARVKNVSSGELSAFFADVEDLIRHVSNVPDADVARVRAKVASTLDEVRRTSAVTAAGLRDTAADLRDRALMAADATDDYVRDRPWTAVGVAAAVGLLLGISVAAAARR